MPTVTLSINLIFAKKKSIFWDHTLDYLRIVNILSLGSFPVYLRLSVNWLVCSSASGSAWSITRKWMLCLWKRSRSPLLALFSTHVAVSEFQAITAYVVLILLNTSFYSFLFLWSTDNPAKVERASKTMEQLITGFASAELFGQDLIQYFTDTTKTNIARIEKFKYEFRYPPDVPRKFIHVFENMASILPFHLCRCVHVYTTYWSYILMFLSFVVILSHILHNIIGNVISFQELADEKFN